MARHKEKGRQPTPPSTPRGPLRREVTRFGSSELVAIHQEVLDYVEMTPDPDTSRAGITDELTTKPKEKARINNALDVLNQLYLLGRQPEDLRNIVVFELNNTKVQKDPSETNNRPGEGGPHYEYQVDWVRPPKAQQLTKPADESSRRINPKPSSESFADRKKLERAARKAQREYEAEQEKKRQERIAVDNVIIDTTFETIQESLDRGNIIVGTTEGEATGTILYSESGRGAHKVVDRTDGTFNVWGNYSESLNPKLFKFYDGIARQIETGVPPDYAPPPLTPEECSKAYADAQNLGLLNLEETSTGFQFGYANRPGDLLFEIYQKLFPSYSQVNLDKGLVRIETGFRPRNRPLHPDFVGFLRKKKSALDAS